MNFIDNMGGRKVIITAVALLVGIIITAVHGDMPQEFTGFLEFLVATFVAGNAIEHIKKGMVEVKLASAAEVVPTEAAPAPQGVSPEVLTELGNILNTINGNVMAVQEATKMNNQALAAIIQRLAGGQ
jgi:hypothetical protein